MAKHQRRSFATDKLPPPYHDEMHRQSYHQKSKLVTKPNLRYAKNPLRIESRKNRYKPNKNNRMNYSNGLTRTTHFNINCSLSISIASALSRPRSEIVKEPTERRPSCEEQKSNISAPSITPAYGIHPSRIVLHSQCNWTTNARTSRCRTRTHSYRILFHLWCNDWCANRHNTRRIFWLNGFSSNL